jgi:hypothetical protein
VQTPTRSSDLPYPPEPVSPSGPGRPPRRSRVALLAGLVAFILVAALLIVILVTGGEEGSGVRSPRGVDVDPEEPRPALAPPTSVEASARPFAVLLQWEAPEGDADRLVVYRDGDRLAPLEPSRTRFVDDSVLPAVRYTYVIEAVLDGKASKSDAIRVKTPPALLGMARLDGTFTVDLRDTSHYGFSSFPGDIQSGWRFKPKCRRGACDVTWKDAQGVALAGVLENTGARYEGTATTRLASCGDLRGSGTVTVRIEVVKAGSVRDAWRATKIVGTFLERFPSQLGCVASGADYQVTGTLIA